MIDVERCLMLNNFYWCVWAIMMAKEEEECDATIYNWEFCRMRIILFAKQREWFGYSVYKPEEVVPGEVKVSESLKGIIKYNDLR